MTITEFLLARIAEVEAVAQETMKSVEYRASSEDGWIVGRGNSCCDCGAGGSVEYGPDRVLAECAAKRAIIEAANSWEHRYDRGAWVLCRAYTVKDDDNDWKVLKISEGKCTCGATRRRNHILKPLATVYADHEDYNDKWRP